jgi:hypothetical protein
MENVNKYHNGKIYKLISPNTDKIYIGSSCEKYLSNRLAGHKKDWKRYMDEKIMKKKYSSHDLFDFGDVKIQLIEIYKCENVFELHNRERYYIEQNKDICLNKSIPNRTYKEYYNDNKELIKQKRKEHYKSLKESIESKLIK